jgi:two-component system, NtrC family, sensor histidine kinase HydH
MKLFKNIQPRYIVAITLGTALLMFGSAFMELSQSRRELLHLLEKHSISLAETIERSSGNIVLSTEQIEHQLAERLLNNAFYIARLDSEGRLNQQVLHRLSEANDIYRINIIDRNGKRIFGNHIQKPEHTKMKAKNNPREVLRPLLRGETDRLIIGLKQARFEEGQRYAVAMKRTRPGGGALVLNLDAQELAEFRKRIGIGKLLQDFSDNADIDYVAIQDREGILAATSRVKELSSIEHDTLLKLALDYDTTITRQVKFDGHDSFEVIKRLTIEGTTSGLVRIGLSMEELRSAENRMSRRMIMMTLVLIALGALVFTALVINQNYQFISKKYADIKSLTGNILTHMQDAVISLDGANRITIFNLQAENLFGIKGKGIIGKQLQELSPALHRCLSEIFATEKQETAVECFDGMARVVSLSLSETTQANGSLESRTAVLKDLTETRRMEHEVRRKEKLSAMGELASGVAHEIRNPLNAISMIAQRYKKEFTPRSGSKEYRALTNVLKKEADRVNQIIQHFLSFARPPKIKLADISAKEFVRHISTLFAGLAQDKGIQFESQCSYEGILRIDQDLLTQAVLNLLQNALDATSKHGSILFDVSQNGNSVLMSVKDTGTGISKELQENIFNIYFTTKSQGNGMGLAITQQIIAQHQGHIQVDSVPANGTEFTISLPIYSDIT